MRRYLAAHVGPRRQRVPCSSSCSIKLASSSSIDQKVQYHSFLAISHGRPPWAANDPSSSPSLLRPIARRLRDRPSVPRTRITPLPRDVSPNAQDEQVGGLRRRTCRRCWSGTCVADARRARRRWPWASCRGPSTRARISTPPPYTCHIATSAFWSAALPAVISSLTTRTGSLQPRPPQLHKRPVAPAAHLLRPAPPD
jgi:hypothetical protein